MTAGGDDREPRVARIPIDREAGRRLVATWRPPRWRERGGGRWALAATLAFAAIFAARLHDSATRGFLPHAAPSSRAAIPFESGESAMRPSRSAALATLLAATATTAHAEELRVPEDYPTIQAAVDAAVDGDVVSIAAGEYDVGLLVLPAKAIELAGRETAGRESVRLTGEAIECNSATETRVLRRLSLVGMSGFGSLRVDRSTVTAIEITIENGRANGVFLDTSARIDMTDCVIRGCSSGGYAYVSSTWNMTSSLIEANGSSPYKTTSHTYGGGAAFHVGSGGVFDNCVFRNNDAPTGGAIGVTFSGSRLFRDCIFEGNTAIEGAVYWSCQAGQAATFVGCSFCDATTADFACSWNDGGGNRFGCATPCPADLVADGAVNGADVAVLLNFWGTDGAGYPGVDLDGDGIVGGADLATLLGAWGSCPE